MERKRGRDIQTDGEEEREGEIYRLMERKRGRER